MIISERNLMDAVVAAKSDILPFARDIKDPDEMVEKLAMIATRAALELMGAKVGDNQEIFVEEMPFPVVFGEWAQQFVLKTHFDRVLAIMVYLFEKEKKETLTTNDIGRMYDKARWKKPANLADVFAKGAERLLFSEAEDNSEDGLKTWRITRTGFKHLTELRVEI